MSDVSSEEKGFFSAVRTTLAVSGVVTLIAGIVLLVWPIKSAFIVTAIFASYLIIGGLVYLALSIFSQEKTGWSRVGHALLGLLYIVAGVIAFSNLAATTVSLALIVGIFIGVSWIIDGVVSLSLLSASKSKGLTVVYAILSLIAGVLVLLSPLFLTAVLWTVLGISLVVLGILQIVRAITLKKDAETLADAVQAG
ncbi:HdeD family acid-resistance protein [Microbacterium sp.]|uniref:HdeD family acid-resistance protein n=1 Tax=Microbacterium sp. TaxID=51671 RepID=UPI003C71A9A3